MIAVYLKVTRRPRFADTLITILLFSSRITTVLYTPLTTLYNKSTIALNQAQAVTNNQAGVASYTV